MKMIGCWTFIYLVIYCMYGFTHHVSSAVLMMNVSETCGPGTILHAMNGNDNCSITSMHPSLSDEYFIFDYNTTEDSTSLKLTKSLDLEVLTEFTKYPVVLTLNYSCMTEKQTLQVRIEPENEFDPIFINSPYHGKVTENEAIGLEILHLGDKCTDQDNIKYGQIAGFMLHSYQISAFDGREFVHLDTKTGRLTTTVSFDYELLPRSFFMLNISVSDDGQRSSVTSVNVSVVDVDDNPPYFTTCKDVSCYVTRYSSTVDRIFQGTLPVSPGAIHAVDEDRGINAPVKYSLDSDDILANNLLIDENLGTITVIEPFSNFTNFTKFDQLLIHVNITAIEETPVRHSTNIEMTVLVYYEFPTTVSSILTSTIENTEVKQLDYILIIEIVVPSSVCLITLIIILVILVRKKQRSTKETRYLVREQEREKNRNVDEHDVSTIDVLSSTPINPYELASVYARISSGSGYEIIEVLSREDGIKDTTDRTQKANNKMLVTPTNEESDPENVGKDVGLDLHPENIYAVVKKPKTRTKNELGDIVNNRTVKETIDEDTEIGQEVVDDEESDISYQISPGDGGCNEETDIELPRELCGDGEVMY